MIYIFEEISIVSQIKMRIAGIYDDFLRRKSSNFHFPNVQNFYLLPMQTKSISSRLNEVICVQIEIILNWPKSVFTHYTINLSIFLENNQQ